MLRPNSFYAISSERVKREIKFRVRSFELGPKRQLKELRIADFELRNETSTDYADYTERERSRGQKSEGGRQERLTRGHGDGETRGESRRLTKIKFRVWSFGFRFSNQKGGRADQLRIAKFELQNKEAA